jgi:hypothetical protein
LGQVRTEIFLQKGLDRDLAEQPVGQIRLIRFNNSPLSDKSAQLPVCANAPLLGQVRCHRPPERLFIKIKLRGSPADLNYSATFRCRCTLLAREKPGKVQIMKKTALVLATAATLGLSAVAAPAPAEARGWGWGGALAGGLIAGAVIGGIASSAYAYGPGYGYYGGYPGYYGGGYAPAYYGGYAPAYYGGYSTAYYGDDYAPAYYGYRYRRVVRPAYAYYGGPRYYGVRYHRWHRHYRHW